MWIFLLNWKQQLKFPVNNLFLRIEPCRCRVMGIQHKAINIVFIFSLNKKNNEKRPENNAQHSQKNTNRNYVAHYWSSGVHTMRMYRSLQQSMSVNMQKCRKEEKKRAERKKSCACYFCFIWSFASCVTSNNFIMCAVRQRCGVFINSTRQLSTLSNFTVKRTVHNLQREF